MTSLFISYSRKDTESARKLTEAFKGQNLDFWIDWEGIPPTVDWWKEIEKGIEEADIFLFLISPDSCASKVCKREIEHAARNGKRLVPLVVRDVKADDAPQELRHLNWIFLRETDNFEVAFRKLIKAIQTDYEWVQVHRQLQVKGLEWERSSQKNDFLLHGEELQDAELQIVANAAKEPYPTDLQREYLLRSRQASDRQRRITRGIAAGVMIALAALALVASLQARAARIAEATAIAKEQIALTNEAEAKRQADIALSRQLAAQAQTEMLISGDRRLSLLYAIESIKIASRAKGFQNHTAEQALRRAMDKTGGDVMVSPVAESLHRTPVGSSRETVVKALSPFGRWLALAHEDNTIHLWDLGHPQSDSEVLGSSTESLPGQLLFDPRERFLVGFELEKVEIWDLASSDRTPHVILLDLASSPLGDDGAPVFSPNGRWLALRCLGDAGPYTIVIDLLDLGKEPFTLPGSIRVAPGIQGHWMIAAQAAESSSPAELWDLDDPAKGPVTVPGVFVCRWFLVSPDGRWFLTFCPSDTGGVHLWDLQDPAQPRAPFAALPAQSLGAFNADSTHLAFTADGVVKVLDLGSNDPGAARILSRLAEPLRDLRFSPDGRRLAGISGDRSILLWDLPSEETLPLELHGLSGFDLAVEHLEFTPDGLHLISVSDDGVTRRWDVLNPYSQSVSLRWDGKEAPYLDGLSFSPDGRWLSLYDEGGYDLPSSSALFDLETLSQVPVPFPLSTIAPLFRPGTGALIGPSETESKVYSWSLADLAAGNIDPAMLDVPGRILTNDLQDRWLISLLDDHTLQVRDLFAPAAAPRHVVTDLPALEPVSRIATNGTWLWMASTEQGLRRWNLEQPGQAPEALASIAGEVLSMTVSPEGNWLGVTDQRTAYIWDLKKPAPEPVLTILAQETFAIDQDDRLLFSVDERLLVVNHGKSIQVIDLQNLAAGPAPLEGVTTHMSKVALSRDGHWLAASATLTGEVRLWDLRDLTAEPLILPENQAVSALAVSPGGEWLAVGDSSQLKLWPLNRDAIIQQVCETLGSNLSRRQWESQFPTEMEYQKTCPQWPEGNDKPVRTPAG